MRLVEWVDSATECNGPWYDREETIKSLEGMTEADMLVKTCGFVLYEDDNIIVMTCSYHAGECGPYVIIPNEAVVKTTRLRGIQLATRSDGTPAVDIR